MHRCYCSRMGVVVCNIQGALIMQDMSMTMQLTRSDNENGMTYKVGCHDSYAYKEMDKEDTRLEF